VVEQRNGLEPLPLGPAKFDSIGVNSSGPGAKGWCKFQINSTAAGALLAHGFSEDAFDVRFGKIEIKGLTVSTLTTKRDADNDTPSSITCAVPESAVKSLGTAIGQVGLQGELTLIPNQMAFDLTKRAE
jgi:hypothetical protein